jgi:hypothetical protein
VRALREAKLDFRRFRRSKGRCRQRSLQSEQRPGGKISPSLRSVIGACDAACFNHPSLRKAAQ